LEVIIIRILVKMKVNNFLVPTNKPMQAYKLGLMMVVTS